MDILLRVAFSDTATMGTTARACEKNFYQTLSKFNGIKSMVERAVDPLRPSLLKSHAKNRSTLEETYFQLIHSWQIYKEDLKLSDDAFQL